MSMDQFGNKQPDFRSTRDERDAYEIKRQQQTFNHWNWLLSTKK